VLAVLKAGNIYVLVDPTYPSDRINYILNHAQVPLVITIGAHDFPNCDSAGRTWEFLDIKNLDESVPENDPKIDILPESLAWIHYTSGSTGDPKGVMQVHRHVLHDLLRETSQIHICPEDRLTFPASRGGDMFKALLTGASVYPTNIKEIGFPGLIKSLQQDEITIFSSVTSTFRYLLHSLNEKQIFPQMRVIKLIGEPLYKNDVELFKQHFSERCILINRLGSNETGTFCQNFVSYHFPIKDNVIAVGFPPTDYEVLLVDELGQPVPDGEIGEFAVKSQYLAVGYWRNPALTGAKFTVDANHKNQRIYRVGDLGQKRTDGSFVHLGRKDFQLKINGNRVEVAEVEAALLNCTNVRETVVVGKDDPRGNKSLVAYLVACSQPPPKDRELRNALAAKLPEFMIPTAYVFLDTLPVIGTGKVDRRKLPDPDMMTRVGQKAPYQAPHSKVEKILCSVWEKLFDIRAVGVDDDFFSLGGHSLLAAEMFAVLDEKFGRTYPLSLLLSSPTIRQLAEHFGRPQATPKKLTSLVPLRSRGNRPSIFAVPGVFGNVLGYAELAREMGDDQPFYALQSVGLDGLQPPIETIEEMAALYIREIKSVQSQGPYVIIGACFGATVAYEIAHQLLAAGNEVAYLGLIDPSNREYRSDNAMSGGYCEAWNKTGAFVNLLSSRLKTYGDELRKAVGRGRIYYVLRKVFSVGATLTDRSKTKRLTRELHQLEVARANRRALRRYRREPLIGPLTAFAAFESTHPRNRRSDKIPWQNLWSGKANIYHFTAKDSGELVNTNAVELSRIISERLETVPRSQIP